MAAGANDSAVDVFTYFTELQPVSTAQALTELVIFTLAIVSGAVGNTAVLVAVACDVRLHSATNYLIANQAASDLLYLTVVPAWAANRWLGSWAGGDALCKACIYTQYVTSTVSIWNMCAIAVERLRSISRSCGTAMTGVQVVLCVTILWVTGLAVNTLQVIKTGVQRVEVRGQELLYCQAGSVLDSSTVTGKWLILLLSIASFMGPVGFLVFIYGKIVNMVRMSSLRVRDHLTHARNSRNLRMERRLLLMLALSAMLFFLMWAPSIVSSTLVLMRRDDLLNPSILTATIIIGTVNMSVNPLLLLYFNKFFSDFVKRTARYICCFKWLLGRGDRHGLLNARAARRVHPFAGSDRQVRSCERMNTSFKGQGQRSEKEHAALSQSHGHSANSNCQTERDSHKIATESGPATSSGVSEFSSGPRTMSTRILISSKTSREVVYFSGSPGRDRPQTRRKFEARPPCVEPVCRRQTDTEMCSVWSVS